MEGCVLPIQCTLIDRVTATKWKSHNYAKHLSSITPVILYHTLPYSDIRSSTPQLRTTLAGSILEAPKLGTPRYKGQNVGPQ